VTALAPTLQAFFTDRLARQKNASPHTIAAYRDTLRMLLNFVWQRTGTAPSRLQVGDIDAPLISAFLDHLEHERGNSPRSRNARLAAIRSLLSFAMLCHPEHAGTISRALAIPPSSRWRYRQGCGSLSWPGSAARTPSWGPEPT
jgi:site-specific recombinase XerD